MRRPASLLAAVTILGLFLFYLRQNLLPTLPQTPRPQSPKGDAPQSSSLAAEPPAVQYGPLAFASDKSHPVDLLVKDNEAQFEQLLSRQSTTLQEAVAEYKRRYGIPPPPRFSEWYHFAKKKRTVLIDEFDTIHHSLLPFWGLRPATIRARVREALGFDGNALIAVMIRDGKASHVQAGPEWQQKATVGMMEQFMHLLPDMDLAFNIHDEPRVVVPHDELSRLVAVAKDKNLPAAAANTSPRNKFSSRPKDVKSGKRVDEVKTTRFNVFAHQPTWIPSKQSCAGDSPARSLEDDATDNLTAYAMGDLGFVYNHTAFSDVCNSPSLSSSYGFFDRPNAFNVVHDLFPIFSQSKLSSFNDILYPSPWYWSSKVTYEAEKDPDWTAKENKLWWVGSTTGGFSRDGGWRRQHRQHMVRKLNGLDNAQIMVNTNLNSGQPGQENSASWKPKEVPRQDYRELIDVHFSLIDQCDPGDCDAQREFFTVVKHADQQDAWRFKYLLDMDGNAFSGRFYAFLKSKSLVFKMAVFREWHEEWLRPWVHYIPLSLRGEEALETVRYVSGEEEGRVQGKRMAEQGTTWANKVLRNADFEVWFFRLLLE